MKSIYGLDFHVYEFCCFCIELRSGLILGSIGYFFFGSVIEPCVQPTDTGILYCWLYRTFLRETIPTYLEIGKTDVVICSFAMRVTFMFFGIFLCMTSLLMIGAAMGRSICMIRTACVMLALHHFFVYILYFILGLHCAFAGCQDAPFALFVAIIFGTIFVIYFCYVANRYTYVIRAIHRKEQEQLGLTAEELAEKQLAERRKNPPKVEDTDNVE